jgi:hypothetical protein
MGDPHGCLASHRNSHWWAPFQDFPLAEILEYDAIRELLGKERRLVSYDAGYIGDSLKKNPAGGHEQLADMLASSRKALINLDGEEHERLRSLVAKAFTPASIAKLAPFMDEFASQVATGLRSGDDVMRNFVRELSTGILCRFLGIPAEEASTFITWIDTLEALTSPARLQGLDAEGMTGLIEADRDLHAFLRRMIRKARAEPRDDFISRLVAQAAATVDDETVVQLLSDVTFAANATTGSALGLMLLALSSHPEVWEAVASDPGSAGDVVEEVLRLHGPTPGPVRRVRETFEYRDRTFERGDVLALSIWSANRDERFWGQSADTFDPERAKKGEHLTFGHGPHFCLGAALARAELQAALVALTQQLCKMRVVGEPAMLPVGGVYGPLRLCMSFDRRT